MADKSLGISVTGDVSDIEQALNNLIELINSIPDRIIDISTQVDADNLVNLEDDMNNLSDKTVDITANVDETGIVTLEGDANDAGKAVEGIGTAAEDASKAITESMDNADSSINTLGSDAANASDQVSGLSDAGNSMASDVGTGGAVAGAGIDVAIAAMVDGAGSYEDSMKRIAATQDGATENADQVNAKWGSTMDEMASNTSRGMGSIRNDIGLMGLVGVHNSQIITDGFTEMSGAAFNTQQPIESVEKAYARMVLTGVLGKRQLMSLGITTQEVEEKTGMSIDDVSKKYKDMDTEQRAAFLNSLMNTDKNTAAVENYKTSWNHALDQIMQAGDYFSRILGASILPTVTAGLGGVSWALSGVADALENTKGPLGDLMRDAVTLGITFAGVTGFVSVASVAMKKFLDISDPTIWQRYVNILKSVGNTVLDTLKVWINWGPDATKSSEGIGKALDDASVKSESFINKIKNFGNTVWDTLKGWKSQWEGSTKDIDFVKGLDDTYTMEAPGFIEKIKGFGVQLVDAFKQIKIPDISVKGGFNLDFLDNIIPRITEKIPSFESAGRLIPKGISDGIGLGLPEALAKALGAPAAIVLGVLQVLSGAGENWHTSVYKQFKTAFNLDFLGSLIDMAGLTKFWDTFKLPAQSGLHFLGIDRILKITPEDFWGYIFGKDAAKRFGDWLNINISGPINHWFLGLGAWFAQLPAKTYGWGSGLIQGITNGVNSALGGLYNSLVNAWNVVNNGLKWLWNLPGNMYNWGKSILLNLAKGITDAIPNLGNALKAVENLFPHSPPKEGPLSNITAENMSKWGLSLSDALSTGFGAGKSTLETSMQGLSNVLTQTPLTPNGFSLPQNSINAINNPNAATGQGGHTINLSIKEGAVQINGNADNNVVKNAGTTLGNSMANVLKGAISNGIKPTVIMRK